MAAITGRQAEALAAIRDHWRTHCQGPTIREVCVALGIASPNGVIGHLAALDRAGLIEWGRGGFARGICLPEVRRAVAAALGERAEV